MRLPALRLLAAAAFAVTAASPVFAQSAAQVTHVRAGVDAGKLGAIVDWLKADVDRGRVPGAVVLIARDGKIVLHEAVGFADKDKKIAMQLDTIHPIASSTKLITTVAALRLIEDNKIKMMAPIAPICPN